MSYNCLEHINIAGIAGVVPENKKTIADLGKGHFDDDFVMQIGSTVGTNTIHIGAKSTSSGDLGIAAAKKLLLDVGWDADSVDGLIFNSQTLDYLIPQTSFRIQDELGLPKGTFLVESNKGCSGYPYCLFLAGMMLETGTCKRIVLINAESHRLNVNPDDRSTALIFGDGAAATALEYTESTNSSFFLTTVDGSHYADLGLRSFKEIENEKINDPAYLFMDGEAVSNFMIREIPRFVKTLLERSNIAIDDIDYFLFHQANAYMVRFIAKRLKLDPQKVIGNIERYGNTSSASIPLMICDFRKELFAEDRKKVMLLGFGAGFEISGSIMNIGGIKGQEVGVYRG